MMFNREITTRLSLLFPRSNQQNKEQSNDENEQVCSFKCDDPVWIRKYSGDVKWSPGKVVEKCGPRNYSVLIGQDYCKCHIDQLRTIQTLRTH